MLHGDSKTKFYLWTEVSLHCMSVPSTDSPGWASLDFLLRWYKLFSDHPPSRASAHRDLTVFWLHSFYKPSCHSLLSRFLVHVVV